MEDKVEKKQHRVAGKILLKAILQQNTPLLISNGRSDDSDIDLITLPDKTPYIPGTSLAGLIRNRMSKIEKVDTPSFRQFWGYNTDKGQNYQSHIIMHSARLCDDNGALIKKNGVKAWKVNREDGIKIDKETKQIDNKYDYQVLQPGNRFLFMAEVTIREGFCRKEFLSFAENVLNILGSDLRVGAMTQNGFGRFSVVDSKSWLTALDFSEEASQEKWFKYIEPDQATSDKLQESEYKIVPIAESQFKIDAYFRIKSSLITADYSQPLGNGKDDSDKIHKMRTENHNDSQTFAIITGKALKGAISQKAHDIIEEYFKEQSNVSQLYKSLFGSVDESEPNNRAIKSTLLIEETKIPIANQEKDKVEIDKRSDQPSVLSKAQTRIKIDRFTGGTVRGALLNTRPIWHNEGSDYFHVSMKIMNDNNLDSEEGQWLYHNKRVLLLHILKHLWTGNLAIGGEKGIGRGVLKGQYAIITEGEKKAEIIQRADSLEITDENRLLKNYNTWVQKQSVAVA